jgi:hypothetical protein
MNPIAKVRVSLNAKLAAFARQSRIDRNALTFARTGIDDARELVPKNQRAHQAGVTDTRFRIPV